MHLIRYRKKKGEIWYKPTSEYLEMFKHCAGGRLAVPTRIFDKEVQPILHMHKIYWLSLDDKT